MAQPTLGPEGEHVEDGSEDGDADEEGVVGGCKSNDDVPVSDCVVMMVEERVKGKLTSDWIEGEETSLKDLNQRSNKTPSVVRLVTHHPTQRPRRPRHPCTWASLDWSTTRSKPTDHRATPTTR